MASENTRFDVKIIHLVGAAATIEVIDNYDPERFTTNLTMTVDEAGGLSDKLAVALEILGG